MGSYSFLSAVEAALSTIIGSIQGVNAVYLYDPKDLGKLPVVTINFQSVENEPEGVGSHVSTMTWQIRLYVALIDSADAAEQTKQIACSILDGLRADPTLSGACAYSLASMGEMYVVIDRDRPMEMFSIEFKATEEVD